MNNNPLYLGLCDAAGDQLAIVADARHIAEKYLLKAWRARVYDGFEPQIKTFAALSEFNGARVIEVPLNQAINFDGGA
jgi:hypothetical protein